MTHRQLTTETRRGKQLGEFPPLLPVIHRQILHTIEAPPPATPPDVMNPPGAPDGPEKKTPRRQRPGAFRVERRAIATRCRSTGRTRRGVGATAPDPPLSCACTRSRCQWHPGLTRPPST